LRQKSKGSNRYTRRYQYSRFQALKDCENHNPLNATIFEYIITQRAKTEVKQIIQNADFPEEVVNEDAFNFNRLLEDTGRRKRRLVNQLEQVDDPQPVVERFNELTRQEDEIKREKEWAQRRTQMVTADREVIRQILANVLKSAEKPEELRALILSTIKHIKVYPRNIEVS
jgi:hypothetical protein